MLLTKQNEAKARMIRGLTIRAFALWFSIVPIFTVNSFAEGFVVDPSVVKVSNMPLGTKYEMISSTTTKTFLEVSSRSNEPVEYTVTFKTCSDYGMTPHYGYQDIPSIKWIKIKNKAITVPAQSKGYFEGVFMRIPRRKEYNGKRYQALAIVNNYSERRNINLEVVIPVLIEIKQ